MNNYSEYRLLSPERIWLEPEAYQRAAAISDRLTEEEQSWQTYLNLLALYGLAAWLQERLPTKNVVRQTDSEEGSYYLEVNDFSIQAIAVENLLDEVVTIERERLQAKATHFYVLLEIVEEAEEAIFRGVLRYDLLNDYLKSRSSQTNSYYLPLSLFNPEPNLLLTYCQYLEPQAITLPNRVNRTQASRTKLSQWLQSAWVEGWEAIDALINPELNLAFSTRSLEREYKKGKLIDFGVELNNVAMTLLVSVKEETENKLGVRVQLYPTRGERYLPPQAQLTLLSKAGKVLQSVRARERDDFIQLKPFKGQLGKRFSIAVSLGTAEAREDFEL